MNIYLLLYNENFGDSCGGCNERSSSWARLNLIIKKDVNLVVPLLLFFPF